MSDSFIHEMPLSLNPQEEKKINIKMGMGRFLYNAVLNEALKKVKLIKESKDYQKAIKLKKSKERNILFKKVRLEYKFSDYDFQKFAIKTKNSSTIKNHLDTHVCQKIATRAYNATNEYLLKKRGKPRFKRKERFNSLEGKDNKAGIKFRNSFISWKGLKLKIIFDKKDKNNIQSHALSCKTKYVRIIRRKIKNKIRFFTQVIQEGKPLLKKESKKAIVGLDIGPSTIAYVSNKKACLTLFCKELKPLFKKIKIYQKKQSRSLRLNNLKNFDKNGIIPNKRFKKSSRYLKNKNNLYELHRKLKEKRKRSHNALANEILSYGNVIKTEKLSYKSFQKRFGRSINFRAPSNFLKILKHKAENAGGYLEEFETNKTFLSQICHCNIKKKKPLSQRWHICKCGVKAQRDLYSAFLSKYVENNKLNITQAKKAWAGANLLLEQTILSLAQTKKGEVVPSSFGLSQRNSLFVKDRSSVSDVLDVVGI